MTSQTLAENLGTASDKRWKCFHQAIASMEQGYQGFWDEGVLADYCWMLCRDEPKKKHHRKSKFQRF